MFNLIKNMNIFVYLLKINIFEKNDKKGILKMYNPIDILKLIQKYSQYSQLFLEN